METDGNKNMLSKSIDTATVAQRRKFIAIQSTSRKKKNLNQSNLTLKRTRK